MKVEFSDENESVRFKARNVTVKMSFMAKLAIRLGLAKDPKGANRVGIVLSVIVMIVSIIMLTRTFSEREIDPKYYYDPNAVDNLEDS